MEVLIKNIISADYLCKCGVKYTTCTRTALYDYNNCTNCNYFVGKVLDLNRKILKNSKGKTIGISNCKQEKNLLPTDGLYYDETRPLVDIVKGLATFCDLYLSIYVNIEDLKEVMGVLKERTKACVTVTCKSVDANNLTVSKYKNFSTLYQNNILTCFISNPKHFYPMNLICNIICDLYKRPIIKLVDGVDCIYASGKFKILTEDTISYIRKTVNTSLPIEESVHKICGAVSLALGDKIEPIEYFGDENASEYFVTTSFESDIVFTANVFIMKLNFISHVFLTELVSKIPVGKTIKVKDPELHSLLKSYYSLVKIDDDLLVETKPKCYIWDDYFDLSKIEELENVTKTHGRIVKEGVNVYKSITRLCICSSKNYVFINSIRSLYFFQVLKGKSAKVVLNTSASKEEIVYLLPDWFKKSIGENEMELFILNYNDYEASNIKVSLALYGKYEGIDIGTLDIKLEELKKVEISNRRKQLTEYPVEFRSTLFRNYNTDSITCNQFSAKTLYKLGCIFSTEFGARFTHRENESSKSWLVPLKRNTRLTPSDYSRNIFHLEFDISATNIKYKIGDALGISAHNDQEEVEKLLKHFNFHSDDVVRIRTEEETEMVTIEQLFTYYLDIWGRPSKRFYKSMVDFVTDIEEKVLVATIADSEIGKEEFNDRLEETYTYADIFYEFPSIKISPQQLIEFIPMIQKRHYSIASAQSLNPGQVDLLVVLVDWVTPKGKKKEGQATHYLSRLEPSIEPLVSVSIMNSVLRFPDDPLTPIIVAGLGTGMAPFRSFIQQREYLIKCGKKIGPMMLFFGARTRKNEWLYGEEWEEYERKGMVKLFLAFSRDQKEKVYIQHKIKEQGQLLSTYLSKEYHGQFYLCGPTWPVKDIENAIKESFIEYQNFSEEDAMSYIEQMKESKRYILEVY